MTPERRTVEKKEGAIGPHAVAAVSASSIPQGDPAPGCFGQRRSGSERGCFGRLRALMPAPTLVLDSGGVLTNNRSSVRHDGEQIHKATLPGAYALVHLWQRLRQSPVLVCSRVNSVNSDHWVVRHACALGLEPDQVRLVRQRADKGPVCLECRATVVVDDTSEALQAMAIGAWKTVRMAVHFGRGHRTYTGPWQEWFEERLELADTHRELAALLEIPVGGVWEFLETQGPPYQPHREEVLTQAWKLLEGLPPPAAPAGAGDSRPPLERRRRQWNRVLKAREAALPEEEWPSLNPEAAVKAEGDGADSAPAASAGRDPAASTEQAPPQKKPKAKLPQPKVKVEAKAKAAATPDKSANPVEPQQVEATVIAKAAPPELSSSSSSYYTSSSEQETTAADQQAGAAAAKQAPVPPQAPVPAAPDAPAAQPAEPQQPWGHRNPSSGWSAAKRRRAELHRAGGNRPARLIETPMCEACGKNQPGAYCPGRLCRRCCLDRACPQHH